MTWLGIGLLVWVLVHLFPSLLPRQRQALMQRLGIAYQGLFSLAILAGLGLMIYGWRHAEPAFLYAPSPGFRLPAIGLITLGFILMAAANFPATRVKRVLRHPQLTGVLLWALAHLLLNGDSRSLLLFSAIALWSAVSIFSISRRDGPWIRPEPGPWWHEFAIVAAGLAVAALAFYFHAYLSGVALIA